jgi:hypothetical protein
LDEVGVHAGHEVLTDVDDKILLIFGNPQRVFDQQLRPCKIHLLIITNKFIYNGRLLDTMRSGS